MEKQIQEAQKQINEIFQSLQFIKTQSSNSNIRLELNEKKILLFFGFQHQDVYGLYAHFQEKSVIAEDEYIKIVKLKQEQKVSYLINTPYSLEGITDNQLCLKQCVTRIILNKVLLQFKDCTYHIVVNFLKLQGQTQQEKLNQITDFGLFNFGQLVFKNQQFLMILNINNNQEITYFLVKNIQRFVLQLNHISKEQILGIIFKNDIFYKIRNEKEQVQDYGPMTLFLLKTMDDYVVQINSILRNYQDQLLFLQQIPNLEDEQDLNNCIIRLIRNLNQFFKNQPKSNLEFTSYMFTIINQLNQQIRQIINQSLQMMNIKIIENFLKDKGISLQSILIPDILAKEQEIEFINQMLKQYITKEFDQQNLIEIQNFQLNINCWNSYSTLKVESIISTFKQITQHIQEGPEQGQEIGVFLFGKTRVGKSTLINLLKNPESLTIGQGIDELCYQIKEGYQSEFKIEHGCMSGTQKISSMKIGDVWIYDCPGFDDNISEEMRIAHRISLYNYLVKTKKVIGFFLIDSSIKDAQIIKDTIDPIYLMLKDKKQIIKENNKWASLVLVKTKQNTRQNYIENWNKAYSGLLQDKYTFYKEMYQNDNQCIEFPQPEINLQQQQILEQNTQIQKKMLQIINENKQNQGFQLDFDLQIESKLFYLYEIVLSMLQIKIEQIVGLLTNQINNYILEDEDTLDQKKKLIKSFNLFIVKQINQQNVQQILSEILEWCKLNDRFKNNSLFLQRAIDDVLKCLKIDNYCKNRKISPIKVDTSILKTNAEKIINLIELIIKLEFGLKAGFIILSIGSIVVSCGAALLAEGAIATATMEILATQVARKVVIRAALTGAALTGAGGSIVTYIIFAFRQNILKSKYQQYLTEQEKKVNQ